MACSFPPSSATRLQAVDAAAVRSSRVPPRAATVSPVQRSLGAGCKAAAAARQEGATQDPAISVSSARTQLDLLEQLTTPTSDGIGVENGAPTEPRVQTTIREQLSAVIGDRDGEYTLPLGKKLKEGLKKLNSLTVSQRRNIKRQALLTKVSGRNDSVFFATVGAFVLVPPLAILAIAVLTGYVQLLP
ncbi:hypothetical protein [Oryza sativa Japonica Group]|uniref:Os01g0666600 protein n=2 Tax=Oryza sativa subsp. japonica TaxID=39947 RepID=A2ZWB8_ORYSJ|nr:uncharacterized protein LOC4326862 [Oryza sativa Japonica Group]KAB8082831.1 hypothetical protein EE612_004852 [Oryza sativa]EAZ13015.1 hypothetical protein OsJ_02936 [Oryza sativa Japonica Group]KAF2951562.1 hypothetical protein DAI22_01g271900 [Oryza sativa Japonica Group]BAD73641.1 hypothetical protein [Oryza sativa Japonica Group]BAF05716.1 Os01g0666600 [Oryza sativa Japonica Group]|eukprot:NP_001043802.1 Os01g0666600 [Oryza sativa Japonica Group]